MATYANDLRLKEITTGDESGTWGTSTNTNLSLIADAFGYGTKAIPTDANATFTMPDATADGTRAMYLKITSSVSLTATRTVTLGPNTVSKVWIIENATTGSQSITIAQGSGATVTIANGDKAMVYTDGAGAGAAVVLSNPTVSLSSGITGTLPVSSGGTGAATLTSNNVILGNGTSAVQFVAPGASGNVLTSNGTTWASTVPGGSRIVRVARTSNTALTSANLGNLIDITSGTFTQTFDAAATLGSGWFCYIQNSGTGDITLDPNSSETIDGLTSYVMYPGEVRLVQCDGAALRTVVLNTFYRVFTASGTFTKPPGYSNFSGFVWGGGASGAKSAASTQAPGGAGGAYAEFSYLSSQLSSSETVTVGSGGASVTTATTAGNAGGTSTFKSTNAYGGAAPGSGSSFALGGAALVASVQAVTNSFIGAATQTSTSTSTVWGGGSSSTSTASAGGTIYGGQAGGSLNVAGTQFNPAGTVFGGAGGASNSATSGVDGTAPAGGGGSTQTGTQSGAGGRGEVCIWGIV